PIGRALRDLVSGRRRDADSHRGSLSRSRPRFSGGTGGDPGPFHDGLLCPRSGLRSLSLWAVLVFPGRRLLVSGALVAGSVSPPARELGPPLDPHGAAQLPAPLARSIAPGVRSALL